MDIPEPVRGMRRTAYKPRTTEGDGARTASKFGGLPWLDGPWPECTVCGHPLNFFLQINLDDLPAPLRGTYGSGLLQFFYCTHCEDDMICEVERQGWNTFSPGSLVRIIQPTGTPSAVGIPTLDPYIPPRLITGWDEEDDYPNWEEAELLGIMLSDQEADALWEAEMPQAGDKLAGWPHWIQAIEYPDCPECGERMRLVFQVDSEDHVPYMWGDVGVGHITQCPTHLHQLAFGWACA